MARLAERAQDVWQVPFAEAVVPRLQGAGVQADQFVGGEAVEFSLQPVGQAGDGFRYRPVSPQRGDSGKVPGADPGEIGYRVHVGWIVGQLETCQDPPGVLGVPGRKRVLIRADESIICLLRAAGTETHAAGNVMEVVQARGWPAVPDQDVAAQPPEGAVNVHRRMPACSQAHDTAEITHDLLITEIGGRKRPARDIGDLLRGQRLRGGALRDIVGAGRQVGLCMS